MFLCRSKNQTHFCVPFFARAFWFKKLVVTRKSFAPKLVIKKIGVLNRKNWRCFDFSDTKEK